MDILTHTLSGIAIGTVVASFAGNGFRKKASIITLGGFGGAFPDFDAISLWSKFDTTIGKLLNLNYTGKEIYFSNLWYSHHGFLHSIFAGLFIALIFGILFCLIKSKFKISPFSKIVDSSKNYKLYFIAFVLGFTIHLLEDMPTPASVWGGVEFLWPYQGYIGGTGDIWWWNNYDIFLIVIGVIVLNLSILILGKFLKFDLRKITVISFIFGFAMSLIQMKARTVDFSYTGHTINYNELEVQSKKVQKEILGDKLYKVMSDFDNKLKINF